MRQTTYRVTHQVRQKMHGKFQIHTSSHTRDVIRTHKQGEDQCCQPPRVIDFAIAKPIASRLPPQIPTTVYVTANRHIVTTDKLFSNEHPVLEELADKTSRARAFDSTGPSWTTLSTCGSCQSKTLMLR
ncbi:hypothetical protein J6590_027607 [Homalodisca vitripennis]|nr:hypothetical protein J6590_027607 [Homalodisca vitripennis]